jgi:hypothetical protein
MRKPMLSVSRFGCLIGRRGRVTSSPALLLKEKGESVKTFKMVIQN